MAEMEKEVYKFPDEVEDQGKPVDTDEDKGKPLEQIEEEQRQETAEPELEIEIEDDTPPEDRGREPTSKEVVQKLEIDVSELDQYSEDAKKKMIQMKKIWNDERRRADSAEREQNAAIDAAKRLREENERIRTMLTKGEEEYVAAMKTTADLQLEMAKKAYKESYDNGDSEGMMNAQQAITNATLQLDRVKNFELLDDDKKLYYSVVFSTDWYAREFKLRKSHTKNNLENLINLCISMYNFSMNENSLHWNKRDK